MTMQDEPQPGFLEGERPHKPADDREEVYFQGSPQVRGELGRMLLLWAVALLTIATPVYFKAPWYIVLGCGVIALFLVFLPVMFTRTITYRISNYRIDYERGILTKRSDTLELWHVEDISLTQSLMDRVLGVGTIIVISHDETTPKLLLKSLPNPKPIFSALKQRIIAVKRQRGVIKMDVG